MSDRLKLDTITIRVDPRDKEKMEAHAKINGFTNMSDFIRTAVTDYMNKDVVWQGVLQGAIESLRSEIQKSNKCNEIFAQMFVYYLQFYFMFTSFPRDKEEILNQLKAGKSKKDFFLNNFKASLKNNPSFMEMIFAIMPDTEND